MKTIKQGDTILNIDNHNKEVTIEARDGNICFLKIKNSAGQISYNCGTIVMRNEVEVLVPGMINDENHSKRTREDIYENWYMKAIEDRNRKAETKTRDESEAKEREKKNDHFNCLLREAKALQVEAMKRLSTMIQEYGSMERLLKDREAKNLLDTITAVDTIFNHRQALNQ